VNRISASIRRRPPRALACAKVVLLDMFMLLIGCVVELFWRESTKHIVCKHAVYGTSVENARGRLASFGWVLLGCLRKTSGTNRMARAALLVVGNLIARPAVSDTETCTTAQPEFLGLEDLTQTKASYEPDISLLVQLALDFSDHGTPSN